MRGARHLGVATLISLVSLLAVPQAVLANGSPFACTGLPAAAPTQQQIDLALRADTSNDLGQIARNLKSGDTGYHPDWRTAAALYRAVMQRTEHFADGTLGSLRWGEASQALIIMHGQGMFGLEPDFPEAFRILRLSQSRGRDVAALYSTTLALQRAEADASEGVSLFHQGEFAAATGKLRSAAEAGLINARALLVAALTYHPEVRNHEEALMWAMRGDDMGHPHITDTMAELLVSGQISRGIDRDSALRYKYSAARVGHAPAMHDMGIVFETGIGIATGSDLTEALCWFRRALQYGQEETIGEARQSIARLRARGVR